MNPIPIFRTLLVVMLCLLPGLAPAQDAAETTREPIEIEADRLIYNQQQGVVEYAGRVVVTQGKLTLKADRLRVLYVIVDGEATSQIDRIVAEGSVNVTDGAAVAEAQKGIYDPQRRIIEMIGDVVTTQDGNVATGERLVVDLDAGTRELTGGRTRSVIFPQESNE